jgi:ABC-type dipeptide/oligopeptide/nickel transport system permease subunit
LKDEINKSEKVANLQEFVEQDFKAETKIKIVIDSFKQNKAALVSFFIVVFLIFIAIFGRYLMPYDPNIQDRNVIHQDASLSHLFGTDEHGRDIFSRILYGTRTSIFVGIIAVCVSLFVGTVFGSIAGYYGGKIDSVIMRVMDVVLSIPSILLAIALMASLGKGIDKAVLAISIVAIPDYAMIVRGCLLSEKENDYVQAAKVVGASDSFIIFKTILPNIASSIVIRATLGVSSAILEAAALGFLGLGVQPPIAEWGDMLGRSRMFMLSYPHEVFFPGAAISLTVLAFNLLGDGLRDAFDPKSRRL